MEENGIITGKIPVTGSGIHKTYEESIIRVIANPSLNSINNEYYMNEDGALMWSTSKEEYNNLEERLKSGELKRIEILSIFKNDGYTMVEFIDPKALRHHLIAEAVMRNKTIVDNNLVNNPATNLGVGMRRTYPESIFRIIHYADFSYMLRQSHYGIFMNRVNGEFVEAIPDKKDISGLAFRNKYARLSELHSNTEMYEELIILNSSFNESTKDYLVEFIDKDIYENYISYERKLKF